MFHWSCEVTPCALRQTQASVPWARRQGGTNSLCRINDIVRKSIDPNKLVTSDLHLLFDATDNHTSNLAVLLPVMKGMRVRIKQNIAVELVIANGTEETLLGVHFQEGTRFEKTNINVECLLSSTIPTTCYVQSRKFSEALPQRFNCVPPCFPDDTVPLTDPFET